MMEDKKDLQEFDLDDILSEFNDGPGTEDVSDLGELSEDMARIVGTWDTEEAPAVPVLKVPDPVSMDTGRINDLISQLTTETAGDSEKPADPDNGTVAAEEVPMDTIRMNQLIDEIAGETGKAEEMSAETIRMDPMADHRDTAEAEGNTVSEDETIRLDSASTDATIRIESAPAEEAQKKSRKHPVSSTIRVPVCGN